MRCQACERNESRSEVICEACCSHYLSIREGRYEERELSVGEATTALRSWVALGASTEKRDRRDAKAPARRGWFGRKPATPPVEEPPPPPPDWKNRVFPVPDSEPVASEPAAETIETIACAAPEAEPVTAPWTELTLPTQPPNEADNEAEAEPATYELPATPAREAEAGAVPAAFHAPEPQPILEPAELPVSLAPEAIVLPEPEPLAVAEAAPPLPAEPELPAAPAVDLSAFFSSLATPAAPAAEQPTEPVAPAAALKPDLSGFFASLSAPAAAEAPVEPTPRPTASPDLGAFFASLSPAAAPAAETPAAPAEPIAPTVDALAESIAALTTPAAAEPEREAPVEQLAPAAEMVPDAPVVPAAEAPAEAVIDLPVATSGFESPVAPSMGVPAAPPAEPVAVAPMVDLSAPNPAASEGDGALGDFFNALQLGDTPEAATPIDFSAFAAPEPAVEPRRPAFEIAIEPTGTPSAAATPPSPRPLSEVRPPLYGEPFSIPIVPVAPPEPPRPKAANEELRALHSTGGLSFVAGDEDEHLGGGLFDGLQFAEVPDQPKHPTPEDDDGPDHRTIEI